MPTGKYIHPRFRGQGNEELQSLNLKALLPLLPLCHNGERLELVDAAIASLAPPGEKPETDLLAFTYEFAALVFKDEPERELLKRRFRVFHDLLRESWVSQELLQQGEEIGLKKGIQQGEEIGIQKGIQQELGRQRELVLNIIKGRFPETIPFAKKQIEHIENPEIFLNLIVKISMSQTEQEVQQHLQEVGKNPSQQ